MSNHMKPVHPGEILRVEFMEPMGLTAYALAKALNVNNPKVNDIVKEKRGISTEMGLLLSAYFGLSDSFWLNLQTEYDRRLVAPRIARKVAAVRKAHNIDDEHFAIA